MVRFPGLSRGSRGGSEPGRCGQEQRVRQERHEDTGAKGREAYSCAIRQLLAIARIISTMRPANRAGSSGVSPSRMRAWSSRRRAASPSRSAAPPALAVLAGERDDQRVLGVDLENRGADGDAGGVLARQQAFKRAVETWSSATRQTGESVRRAGCARP